MIFQDIKIDYNYDLVVKEILSCRNLFVDIPPYQDWIDLAKQKKIFMVDSEERYDSITVRNKANIIKKSIHPPKSFYIKSPDPDFQPYLRSKKSNFEDSKWNPSLGSRLKYTKTLIENLPFEHVGLVRVFILENTFLPTHHDKIFSNANNSLGLSLVPIHSGSPLMVYDRETRKIESIFSNCFLFDDSHLHGIPMVNGLRIDIRVFGKFKDSVNLG